MMTATRVQRTPWSLRLWMSVSAGFALFSLEKLWMVFLMTTLLMSAVAVTYVRGLGRTLVTQQQSLLEKRQTLQVAWDQLLLDRSTWSNPSHIQKMALDAGMVTPDQVEMVKM